MFKRWKIIRWKKNKHKTIILSPFPRALFNITNRSSSKERKTKKNNREKHRAPFYTTFSEHFLFENASDLDEKNNKKSFFKYVIAVLTRTSYKYTLIWTRPPRFPRTTSDIKKQYICIKSTGRILPSSFLSDVLSFFIQHFFTCVISIYLKKMIYQPLGEVTTVVHNFSKDNLRLPQTF